MCPCAKEGEGYPGLHWDKCSQQAEARNPSPLLSTDREATPGVVGPVLDSSQQGRHGRIGESPAKGHSDEGMGAPLVCGKAETRGCSAWRRTGSGGSHQCM